MLFQTPFGSCRSNQKQKHRMRKLLAAVPRRLYVPTGDSWPRYPTATLARCRQLPPPEQTPAEVYHLHCLLPSPWGSPRSMATVLRSHRRHRPAEHTTPASRRRGRSSFRHLNRQGYSLRGATSTLRMSSRGSRCVGYRSIRWLLSRDKICTCTSFPWTGQKLY